MVQLVLASGCSAPVATPDAGTDAGTDAPRPDAFVPRDSGSDAPRPACDIDDDCDDGVFCNGAERCEATGCAPALGPRVCDDGRVCTLDHCDATEDVCLFECNEAMPACASEPECGSPSCTGRFQLVATTPGILTQNCAAGMVDYDFSVVTFANVGPGSVVTATGARSLAGVLSDSSAPVCPSVEAVAVVAGSCEERYTLSGTFTDEDTFEGTFEFAVCAGGGGGGCTLGTTVVTGTRMP